MNAVDLDTATVTLCEEKRSKLTTKLLPKKAARQLRARLAALLEKVRHHRKQARKLEATQDDGAIDFEFKMKRAEMQLDLEIREVFLHFMVSVLVRERSICLKKLKCFITKHFYETLSQRQAGYRHFLLPITSAPTVGATDVGNLFDQRSFLRSRDRNFHSFYELLMKTQG